MPKKPKITASDAVWDRYKKRAKEVAAHNRKVEQKKEARRKFNP